MVIEDLRIRDFGRLRNARLVLQPGLNVLWGPNEVGKSTVLAAILMLLFDKPTTTKSAAARWRRWGAERMYQLEMTFRAQGRHWQVCKDFEQQRAVLRDLDSGQTWEDPTEVQRVLAGLVGTDSPAVYQSTAGLRQQEIVSLQEGRRLGELLQESVSGAADEVSVTQVLAKLEAALADLQRGTKGAPTRNLGEIAAVEEELRQLQRREQEIAGVLERTEQARRTLEAHREELEELNRQISDLQRLVNAARDRQALEERRDALREQALELQRRVDRARVLRMQIERAQQDLAALPEVTVEEALEAWREQQALEQALQQEQENSQVLRDFEERRRQVEAKAAQAQAEAPYQQLLTEAVALQESVARLAIEVETARAAAETAQRTEQREADRRKLRWATLAMGGLFIIAGAAAGALSHPLFFFACLLGVGLAGWGLTLSPRGSAEALRAATEEAERRLTKSETDHWNARLRLQEILQGAGVNSVQELSEKVGEGSQEAVALGRELSEVQTRCETVRRQLESARQAQATHRARLQALLGGRFESPAQMQEIAQRRERLEREIHSTRSELEGTLLENEARLEERLRALAVERAALDQRLEAPEMVAAQLSPERLARISGDLERKQQRREELLRQRTEAETLLRTAGYDEEDLAAVREQLAEAEQRRARLRRRERVMTIVLETLRQARKETLLAATDILEPTIGELLQRLTLGRYSRVTVNRETLEPVAFSPEKGGAADQQTDLSLATREQLYLAARLALTRLLWPKEGPPILLDDPLVNFDASRHQEALQLLAEFARGRQILLFTCSEPWAEYSDRVIDLTQAELPPAEGEAGNGEILGQAGGELQGSGEDSSQQ
jgi:DNA repair exonuclease SbcCD ATPase subunit